MYVFCVAVTKLLKADSLTCNVLTITRRLINQKTSQTNKRLLPNSPGICILIVSGLGVCDLLSMSTFKILKMCYFLLT